MVIFLRFSDIQCFACGFFHGPMDNLLHLPDLSCIFLLFRASFCSTGYVQVKFIFIIWLKPAHHMPGKLWEILGVS